jgi:hypothetical protein
MKRRTFIQNSAAVTAASFLGMHDMLAGCAPSAANISPGAVARITDLDLITGSSVKELKEFYTSLLEFPLITEQANRFTMRAGETKISFIQTAIKEKAPFYHFAFNIPENKILLAREWQLKRTPLSTTPPHMTDPGYPDDVRHFRSWNAHSVFFWDPAGNLVEYIARHDLNNSSSGEFSNKDLLCASEIAFIVEDTDAVANEVKSTFNLQQYRGGDADFRAIGDEQGLLLMIRKGRVWESHTSIARTPETIKTAVTIRAGKGEKWTPGNYPFEIHIKN